MALPNGLPQVSDLGSLLGILKYDLVDIPLVNVPFTSITNRAQMYDLSKDLGARMGVDRIQTQQAYSIQDEFGPNGEPVLGIVGDVYNQIRFVGSWFSAPATTTGSQIIDQTPNGNSFVEITFYGTGLNVLMPLFLSNHDIRASVDGGAESVNLIPANTSGILTGRNYAPNQIIPVTSGLTLGTHTVKLRSVANNIQISGFEIINSSSNVVVNPGTIWLNGKKIYNSTQVLTPYNSNFESGTLGSRGGRVAVYLKSDGSVGKSVTPTNSSAAYLSSADHTNEDVARIHYWREFGAGGSDDFSTALAANARAFTLSDGTTTLLSTQANSESINNVEVIYAGNTFFQAITFVGTGLDVIVGSSGSRNTNITIDGGAPLNIVTSGGAQLYKQKIVSGLPYGTHTVKFSGNGAACLSIAKFIIYQPKKPALPSGAVELADYNVLANFAAGTVASVDTIATGVLRKNLKREATLVTGTGGTTGGWIVYPGSPSFDRVSLQGLLNDQLNAYMEYTFFGTGCELRNIVYSTTSNNIQVSLQSLSTGGSLQNATIANFPTMNNSVYGTGVTFTNTTGILDMKDPSTVSGVGFTIKDLPLGLWKVRFQNLNSGSSNYLEVDCLDIITPIHSHKNNNAYSVQNTISIGNQGLLNKRKTLSEAFTKNITQTYGIVNTPAYSGSTPIPTPDLQSTHYSKTGKIAISYSIRHFSTGNANSTFRIYVNGTFIGTIKPSISYVGLGSVVSDRIVLPVNINATNHVAIYWNSDGSNTSNLEAVQRNMTIEDVE